MSAPEDLPLRDSGGNGCPARGRRCPSRLEGCCDGSEPSHRPSVARGQASIPSLAPRGGCPPTLAGMGPLGCLGSLLGAVDSLLTQTLLVTQDSASPPGARPGAPSSSPGLCDVMQPQLCV